MFKVLKRVNEIMSVIGGLLLLFISFSIGYSIVTRKLNLPTPVWVVQFNEYALLWVTFLATGWVLAKEKHVSVQILIQYLGGKGERALAMIHSFVGMVLCGIFCWYGVYSTWDQFARHVVDVASVDVPKGYIILVIPLGFCLLSLQFLSKFVSLLSGEAEGEASSLKSEHGGTSSPTVAERAGEGG